MSYTLHSVRKCLTDSLSVPVQVEELAGQIRRIEEGASKQQQVFDEVLEESVLALTGRGLLPSEAMRSAQP